MAVSTSAIVSRTRDGIFISPMPGISITIVPTRAKVRRNAAISTGRTEMSIFILRRNFLAGDRADDRAANH